MGLYILVKRLSYGLRTRSVDTWLVRVSGDDELEYGFDMTMISLQLPPVHRFDYQLAGESETVATRSKSSLTNQKLITVTVLIEIHNSGPRAGCV